MSDGIRLGFQPPLVDSCQGKFSQISRVISGFGISLNFNPSKIILCYFYLLGLSNKVNTPKVYGGSNPQLSFVCSI